MRPIAPAFPSCLARPPRRWRHCTPAAASITTSALTRRAGNAQTARQVILDIKNVRLQASHPSWNS